MNIVSFEVAQVIKKEGYHDASVYYYGDTYDDEDSPKHKFELCGTSIPTFVQDWNNIDKFPEYSNKHVDYWRNVWSAPYYFEVFNWLWNEKGIKICLERSGRCFINGMHYSEGTFFDNPEDAYESAIKYICKKGLKKWKEKNSCTNR